MSPDIHVLTGAYAADALDDDERDMFEQHLAVCDACAREVAELQATTARLAAGVAQEPPSGMKDAVMARIDEVRQDPPPVSREPVRRPSRPWATRIVAAAAAVLLLAVVGLAATVARLDGRLDALQDHDQQVAQVLAAPDADVVGGTSNAVVPRDATARAVVSRRLGQAVFLASSLPPAGDERTYELWLIGADGAAPAGLFDAGADGQVTQVLSGDLRTAVAIGVTLEPAGGSSQPTSDPIIVLDLPAGT